jgi:PleD family two-component response regulator
LESNGHSVLIAPTPSQALALAKRRPPDCVVAKAPATTEELERFRASLASRCPDSTIPVIPVGAHDSPEAIVQSIVGLAGLPAGGAAPSTPQGPCVLVLDDRGIARKNLAAQIAAEGWHVLEAADAKEATLKLLDRPVDCLLLNAVLAGQSTLGVIKSAAVVRDVHPHPFSIVVLADTDDGSAATIAMKHGADDVVSKNAAASVMIRRMVSAVRIRDLRREIRSLKERIAQLEGNASLPR